MSRIAVPEMTETMKRGRHVVKKIDSVLIPLLFCIYLLNFMDKVVLSSAAVFGLRDDNGGTAQRLRRPLH